VIDFLIEFMALVSKAQTDDQHAIFLLKKNINREIIRAIIVYLPTQAPKSLDVTLANFKARIKPTAPLSVFDKENSIEFLL